MLRARGRFAVPQILLLLLVLAMAGLPPLAHAIAPDPSWIAGIYDNADGDDVVALVTAASGDLGPAVAAHAPILHALDRLTPVADSAVPARVAPSDSPRGPPLS